MLLAHGSDLFLKFMVLLFEVYELGFQLVNLFQKLFFSILMLMLLDLLSHYALLILLLLR